MGEWVIVKWEDVYIFISSTFNDMHAERSYLISSVFPELRSWCEEHFLHLYDVDLRWGVSEEDAGDVGEDEDRRRVVKQCLEGIDSCKPFFLCLLGQRRGWIPDIRIVPDDFSSKNLISKGFPTNLSITEMEILHSLSNQGQNAKNHCLFLFRDSSFLNSISDSLTKEIYCDNEQNTSALSNIKVWLKANYPDNCEDYYGEWNTLDSTPEIFREDYSSEELIRARSGRLTNYHTDTSSLKEYIISFLQDKIKIEFPKHFQNTESSQLVSEQQEHFVSRQTISYVNLDAFEQVFNRFVASESDSLFVLMSQPRGGKSAFIANTLQHIKGIKIIRFIGTSSEFLSESHLYRSLLHEFAMLGIIDISQIPSEEYLYKLYFLDLIKYHIFDEPITIIIDGSDQLEDFKNLSWLPVELASNMKLIISFNTSSVSEVLLSYWKENGVSIFTIPELDKQQISQITKQYLQLFLKKFDKKNMEELLSLPQVSNPLCLRLILSELRVFGSFEQLMKKIKTDFGISIESVITEIILRLEKEHSYTANRKRFIQLFFGIIANSNNGLPIEDLSLILIDSWGSEAPSLEIIRQEINILV